MEQLSLKIVPKLSYAPGNFVVHAGARSLVEHFALACARSNFWLGYLVGERRTGKSHLAIKCADLAARAGRYPRIVEGASFHVWLTERFPAIELRGDEVFLIDDAQLYLEGIHPGGSGPLVSMIERLRAVGSTLLFFSDRHTDAFPCDEHIVSRLRAGYSLVLGAPEEAELFTIVGEMARQRGVRLTPRKINFLVRRLGRTIPEVELFFERAAHLAEVLGKSYQLPVLADAV